MLAIVAEREGLLPKHGIQRQVGIKMREEIAAARRFEVKRLAERKGIDGDEQETLDAGEMPARRFERLTGRREMDVAIGKIDRSATKYAVEAGLLP